jgi:hypothetical protein
MSPTIKTGALAISQRVGASSLEKGQIVSVPTSTGSRVTHRIVDVTREGDTAILRLRGDANQATDATPYRVTHADRVLFDVPGVGYAVGWLSGPFGLFLLGLYAAFLLSVLLKRSPETPGGGGRVERLSAQARVVPPSRPARRKGRHAMVTSGLTLVLMSGTASVLVLERTATPTLAAWTDPAGVASTSFTANIPAPVVSCGALGKKSTTISWTAVSQATGYRIHDGALGGTPSTVSASTTSKTYTAAIANGAFSVEAQFTYPLGTWTSALSNSVNYTVVAGATGVCG